MKKCVFAMAAIMLMALVGCDAKKTVRPLVLGSYNVANNTLGYLHNVDNGTIVTNIDKLVTGATAINKALELVNKHYDNEYVKKAYDASTKVLGALVAIQSDPSTVIEKVAEATGKLEEVRSSVVAINDKLSLGIVFPEPKVLLSGTELEDSILDLEKSTKEAQ